MAISEDVHLSKALTATIQHRFREGFAVDSIEEEEILREEVSIICLDS